MPDPGEVPARAGRAALAQGRGRQPARRRGRSTCSATSGPPARASSGAGRRADVTRVAAVDCGTNTISCWSPTWTGPPAPRRAWSASCGSSGSARTSTAPAGSPTRRWSGSSPRVEEYAARRGRPRRGARCGSCATSAARDAEQRRGVRRRGPGPPRRRARGGLRRRGGRAVLRRRDPRRCPSVPSRSLVLDIGGGSTELIVGGAPGEVGAAHSLDIGSVRLTERPMPSDPPTAAEVAAARGRSTGRSTRCRRTASHVGDAPTLVGVAGTVTTVAALLLGPGRWDREPGPPRVVRAARTCTTWPSGCSR